MTKKKRSSCHENINHIILDYIYKSYNSKWSISCACNHVFRCQQLLLSFSNFPQPLYYYYYRSSLAIESFLRFNRKLFSDVFFFSETYCISFSTHVSEISNLSCFLLHRLRFLKCCVWKYFRRKLYNKKNTYIVLYGI